MAIECFEIKWTKPFLLSKILLQQESKRGGVYALFKGGTRKSCYVGRAVRFDNRLATHKQSFFRMMNEAERKKLTARLGLISSFETDHMTDVIKDTQLASIENFLITKLQLFGNDNNTKKRSTAKYPIILINSGDLFSGISKFMSHSNTLLKALGKVTTKKKRASSSWP